MEITIEKSFLIPLEIPNIMALSYMPELLGENEKKEWGKRLEKLGLSNEKMIEDSLILMNQIVETFEKKMVKSDDDAFFFKDSDLFFCVTNSLMYLLVKNEPLLDDIDELSEEEIHSQLATFLFEKVPKDITETMEFIQNSELEFIQAKPWETLCMFKNPKKYLEQFIQIINRNVPAFEYTVRQQKRTIDTLMSLLKKEIPFIKDALKQYQASKEYELSENITIRLSLIAPTIFISYDLNTYYAGLFFLDTIRTNLPNESSTVDLSLTLKILGDVSKYEILKFLKGTSKYNSEIAEHLNLTQATVSHHMTILINHGLVTAEKIEKKVYYTISAERVKEILMNVEYTLL